MANIITNKLYIITEDKNELNKVLEFIQREHEEDGEAAGIGTIDFNKIIPVPSYVIKDASISDEIKYGKENCEIGWMQNNWGTKGNAFDIVFDKENNLIIFNTFWDGVQELISKLSTMFPNTLFEYKWLDECYGTTAGEIKFTQSNAIFTNYIDVYNTKEFDQFVDSF